MWAEKKEYYPLMLFVNFLLPLFSGEIMIPTLSQSFLYLGSVIVIYGLIVRRVRHTARRAQRTNLAMVSVVLRPKSRSKIWILIEVSDWLQNSMWSHDWVIAPSRKKQVGNVSNLDFVSNYCSILGPTLALVQPSIIINHVWIYTWLVSTTLNFRDI